MCRAYCMRVAIVVGDRRSHPITLSLSGHAANWMICRASDHAGEKLKLVGRTRGVTILPPKSVTTFVTR